jgi:hypothetical protein
VLTRAAFEALRNPEAVKSAAAKPTSTPEPEVIRRGRAAEFARRKKAAAKK